jgi:hypothetical protein
MPVIELVTVNIQNQTLLGRNIDITVGGRTRRIVGAQSLRGDELNQSRLQSQKPFENALALLRGVTSTSDRPRVIVEVIWLVYFSGRVLQAGSFLEEENT